MKNLETLFHPQRPLLSQLSKLTEDTAAQWYKEYLDYHKGVDQGVKYLIGYFADVEHRNNLYKWLFNETR